MDVVATMHGGGVSAQAGALLTWPTRELSDEVVEPTKCYCLFTVRVCAVLQYAVLWLGPAGRLPGARR